MKKMAKKSNFFKITPLKALLFLILPVFYAQTSVIYCFTVPCNQPHAFLPLPIALFFYVKYSWQGFLLFFFAAGAVLSYLASCTLASLLKRLSRK